MTMHRKLLVLSGALVLTMSVCLAAGFAQQTAGEIFEKALFLEEAQGKLQEAIDLYQNVVDQFSDNPEMAAKAQLRIGLCYGKLGQKNSKLAGEAFQKVIDNFPGQKETVREARENLNLILNAQAPAQKGDKGVVIRKLWGSDAKTGDFGSPSPDGRYFAFHHYRTGDMAIRDIVKGVVRRLNLKTGYFETPEMVGQLCWSPDAKQIAYYWNSEPGEIRIVNRDGSGVRTVHTSQDWISPYAWSPDGKLILIILNKYDGKNEYKFGLLDVEQGSFHEFDLIVNPSPATRFSPDGRFLAFTVPEKNDPDKKDISLFAMADKTMIPLVEHPANDYILGWGPAGHWVLFASDRSGTMDVWGIRVSDGHAQGDPMLVKKGLGNWGHAWMTRTGILFYSVNVSERDVYVAEVDFDSNRVLDGPKRATEHYVNTNFAPAWSADGQYLAFASNRAEEPNRVLCILSNETGEVRELFPEIIMFRNPPRLLWPADGRSVIHSGFDKSRNIGFFRTDLKTGEMSTLFIDGPGQARGICFSQDGKTVFYTKGGGGGPAKPSFLRAYDLETKKTEILYEGGFLQGLALAPDGKSLAFSENLEPGGPERVVGLRTFPVEGGEPRTLFRSDKGGWIETLDWTPDGRFILFTRMMLVSDENRTRDHIWIIPARGGEARETGIVSNNIAHLRISPDGRHIAFTMGTGGKEIWALENFIPKIENGR